MNQRWKRDQSAKTEAPSDQKGKDVNEERRKKETTHMPSLSFLWLVPPTLTPNTPRESSNQGEREGGCQPLHLVTTSFSNRRPGIISCTKQREKEREQAETEDAEEEETEEGQLMREYM